MIEIDGKKTSTTHTAISYPHDLAIFTTEIKTDGWNMPFVHDRTCLPYTSTIHFIRVLYDF